MNRRSVWMAFIGVVRYRRAGVMTRADLDAVFNLLKQNWDFRRHSRNQQLESGCPHPGRGEGTG